MAENDIITAYKRIPIVTRFLITFTVLLTLAEVFSTKGTHFYHSDVSFGYYTNASVSGAFGFNWILITKNHQFYRLATTFFHHHLGLTMLFDLYILYRHGSELENTRFSRKSGDFVWFLIFTSILSLVASTMITITQHFHSMQLAIIYLWSRVFSQKQVEFLFGVRFSAANLPWVLLGYTFVVTGGAIPWNMVVGVASAHIFHYLQSDPSTRKYTRTPLFLGRFFADKRGPNPNQGYSSSSTTSDIYTESSTAHNWGRGHSLR